MPTFTKILAELSNFSTEAKKRLNQLVSEWKLVSDISFSDLVLYVRSGERLIVASQIRPVTAATLFEEDLHGDPIELDFEQIACAVEQTREILTIEDDDVMNTWVPIPFEGKVIAVLRVATALIPNRVPLALQDNYEFAAQTLISMMADGEFPIDGSPSSYQSGTPHIADGVVLMDVDGVVTYADPNAISIFRAYGLDRTLKGNVLAEMVAENLDSSYSPDETLPVVLLGKAAWMVELEAHDIVMMLRSVPLREHGERVGAILLTRNITRMRMHERELMSKDATIKEINHRVKNNLQTVSALLRIQARRATNSETRAALENAQHRIETIAIVHEQLSQTIDEIVEFDELFSSMLHAVRDVAVTKAAVEISVEGSFGVVRAEQATALAVVLNELISNAIEHGLSQGGRVWVRAHRNDHMLTVDVEDNGEGMHGNVPTPGMSSLAKHPESPSGLGTQIVRTLVASELNGKIVWSDVDPHGVLVHLEAQMR